MTVYERWRHRIGTSFRQTRLRLVSPSSLTPSARWTRNGRDRLRTRGLRLHPGSIVLDFGGHVGDWAAEIVRLYGSTVHVFEPVPQFAAAIVRRFEDDSRVIVHSFGVGMSSRREIFNLAGDATGTHMTGAPLEVEIHDVSGVVALLDVDVALAKINIEGGEYELLPALAGCGYLERVDRPIIQFHDIEPDSRFRRTQIQETLAATHNCDWYYPFVWESWTRKSHFSVINSLRFP